MQTNASQRREAFWHREIRPERVMALGFLCVILLGSGLLSLPIASTTGASIGWPDALFTSVSAVCVTGLTVVDVGLELTRFGQCVLICLIQVGGLGFMIVATLVMIALGRRISLRDRVLIRESMNATTLSGLVRLSLWYVALAAVIELGGACLLALRFVPQFGWRTGLGYGVFHSISAFCNAGFDLFGNYQSLAAYRSDPLVLGVIALLIVLGGLGFSVILECARHRAQRQALSLHTKLVLSVTAALLVLGAAVTLALEWDNPRTLAADGASAGEKVLNALFQSVTLRTAGFASFDQAGLSESGKLVSLPLMFIGASPASTGGGVKTTTVSAILLLVASVVRGRRDVNVFGKQLPTDLLRRAMTIVALSFTFLLVCACALSISERHNEKPIIDLLYEAVSALATVGVTSVGTNTLNGFSRCLLMLMMYLGRVGPMTMALAFANRLDDHAQNRIHYPEEKIMIG